MYYIIDLWNMKRVAEFVSKEEADDAIDFLMNLGPTMPCHYCFESDENPTMFIQVRG